MNSQGGSLVIGVDDNGRILGLDRDFQALGKKKSWDEWIMHFFDLFNNYTGKEFNTYVKVNRININEMSIAIVEVKKNDIELVYLEPEGKAEFFIRASTTTQLLNSKEAIAYSKQQWHG
jgi:predicted HTH transcriptional regulator